jgi:hypothetical protein
LRLMTGCLTPAVAKGKGGRVGRGHTGLALMLCVFVILQQSSWWG